jgi:hypothetical protein
MLSEKEYKRKEIVVDAVKANLYIGLMFIPAIVIFGVPFYFFWRDLYALANVRLYMQENIDWLKASMPWIIFGSLIGGIVGHELLHGLTWARFARGGFKSIRFGIMWKILTPYCHCTEPLSLNAYRLGVIMPGVVLGFLPLLIGFSAGHLGLFLFGMLFTVAAGGDMIIMYLLRNESKDSFVQDHPEKIGCYVYTKIDPTISQQ